MWAAWDNFFIAQVGASASLTGLLFVGISINMTKILSAPSLPNRALEALFLLGGILLAASFVLVPGQPVAALGIELVGVGGCVVAMGAVIARRTFRTLAKAYRTSYGLEAAAVQGIALGYAAGGALLVGGDDSGIYLAVPAMLGSFVVAILVAWVLLVEVNR